MSWESEANLTVTPTVLNHSRRLIYIIEYRSESSVIKVLNTFPRKPRRTGGNQPDRRPVHEVLYSPSRRASDSVSCCIALSRGRFFLMQTAKVWRMRDSSPSGTNTSSPLSS